MRRLMFATLLITMMGQSPASACSRLNKAGEKMRREQEARYLRKESDKIVRGVWRSDNVKRDEENAYADTGYIEVINGSVNARYRVSIRGEINCGFPYYYVKDGDFGRFYLQKEEFPDEDDKADGFVDNFDYVHFKPLKRK